MNARIKQLETQCWTHRIGGYLIDGQLHFDSEKFAELILRDCIDTLEAWRGEPFPFDENLAVSLIKQHFGMK